MKIDAPVDVIERVKARIRRAAERAGGDRFWGDEGAFPSFKKCVEALPELELARHILFELKVTLLDACRMEGINVPKETWEALGVGQFYQPAEGHRRQW